MSVYEELNIEELKYYYELNYGMEAKNNISIEEYIKNLVKEVEQGIQAAEESINMVNSLSEEEK